MPVVTKKAALISGRDSTPPVKSTLATGTRVLYEQCASVAVETTDSIGSRYIMASVPSSASFSALFKLHGGLTSMAANIGLYRTTQDGGAAVSATLFASALSLATADSTGTNILHNSGTLTLAHLEQPIWQVLGLAGDPQIMYDVAAVSTAAPTAAGTLAMRTLFSQGN